MDEEAESNLDEIFNVAASEVARLYQETNEENLLYLYSRYKQATIGDCNTAKPSFWELEKKRKWTAWQNLKSMTPEKAKQEYINKIKELNPQFSNGNKKGNAPAQAFGISVSRLVHSDTEEDEDLKHDSNARFFDICKKGDLNTLINEAKRCEIGLLKDSNNRTLLHWACDRGMLDIAKFLIENCTAKINEQDCDLLTPLHYAVQCEQPEIVKLLLKSGANTELKDCDGDTPLDCASTVIKQLFV